MGMFVEVSAYLVSLVSDRCSVSMLRGKEDLRITHPPRGKNDPLVRHQINLEFPIGCDKQADFFNPPAIRARVQTRKRRIEQDMNAVVLPNHIAGFLSVTGGFSGRKRSQIEARNGGDCQEQITGLRPNSTAAKSYQGPAPDG